MALNIWRRGSLLENPYTRNAFRITRVPREVVRHRTIVQLIGQTKRIVNTDPSAHTVKEKPVMIAQVNVAEQILLDPKQRILEELLTHATEMPPLERVRRLAADAAAVMAVSDTERLPVTNLGCLEPWALAMARQFLDSIPGPDPSFGALELDFVPPFGRPGEE
jgi:hypothetical protein